VSQSFLHGATPLYENAYKPEKVDSGERISIAEKLLSLKRQEVTFTLEHAVKAQRGSRGIVLLFL